MAKDPLFDGLERTLDGFIGNIDGETSVFSRYRVEICWMVGVAALYGALLLATRDLIAAAVILYVIVMLILWRRQTRSVISSSLEAARIIRRWDEAVQHCGFKHSIPLTKVRRVDGGHRARVTVGKGISFANLDQKREPMAAHLRIRELRVRRDPENASTGTVMLIRDDVLANRAGGVWPTADGIPRDIQPPPPPPPSPPSSGPPRRPWGRGGGDGPPQLNPGGAPTSLWRAIPVGVDEHGDVQTIILPERNLLIGGSPGAGKSVALNMLLATAALDPSVDMWLIDGKMVDFAPWEFCAKGVGHTTPNAILVLSTIQMAMERRFREMRERGLTKVTEETGMGLSILFIDELALFTASGDKQSKEFTNLLTDLVARGRAAGIIICAATQKPEGSVVSTNLRDLFAYRLAFRCGTPEASDTILGRGHAARGSRADPSGADASTIPPGNPGTGYLMAEDGMPVKIRTYHLKDDDVRVFAARAREVRRI